MTIDAVMFKGILTRGNNADAVRERLFFDYQKDLRENDIDSVSLDGGQDPAAHGVTHVLEVQYGENFPAGEVAGPAAVDILASLLFRPAEARILATLYQVAGHRPIFSNIKALSLLADLESPEQSFSDLGISYSGVRLALLMSSMPRQPSIEVALARFGTPDEARQFFAPKTKSLTGSDFDPAIARAAALNPDSGTFTTLIQLGLSEERALSGLLSVLPSQPCIDEGSQAKWTTLAQGGNADVEWNIGDLYASGQVFTQNLDDAMKWYRISAQQGSAMAQERIGAMYAHGRGVPENGLEALRWLRMAAQQGLPMAYDDIGMLYQGAESELQDLVEARKAYEFAAERGFGSAQNHIGMMYSDGIGGPQDYVQAMKWFLLAAKQLVPGAAKNRDFVGRMLTLAQLTEAKSLAAHWQPKK